MWPRQIFDTEKVLWALSQECSRIGSIHVDDTYVLFVIVGRWADIWVPGDINGADFVWESAGCRVKALVLLAFRWDIEGCVLRGYRVGAGASEL